MWASNGVSLDLGQVLREKRLVRLMNLWPLLEFCLGKSEVISGDSHSKGLSKVHNPALPPILGALTRRQLFHGSWTSNIIRNRWWMKRKKFKSYPCRFQKCYLFWNGNLLQNSCLKNPMDGGAWQAIVHRVAKSRTRWATEHRCTTQ